MENCEAAQGGGVYLEETLKVEFSNVTITNCKALLAHNSKQEVVRGGGIAYMCPSEN